MPARGRLSRLTDQHDFGIRLGWGPEGARAIGPGATAIVVVDVLSFTTAVDIAVGRGAIVHPFHWNDERAADHARAIGAELAAGRSEGAGERTWSLSPASLVAIPPGTRLLLPSPNGAAVTLAAAEHAPVVLAGSLRNAPAVAAAASATGGPVAVVAAGERWPDGTLRVAVEDLVGAGAVVSHLVAAGMAPCSPEGRAAAAAYAAMAPDLESALLDCVSGRELVAGGFVDDVILAAQGDVSDAVPVLRDGAFTATT